MNAIKYSLLAAVGFYFVYDEIRAGLDYWLPAVGYAADHGYVWAPFAFLAVVGAGLLTGLMVFVYEGLSILFD